MSNGIIQNARQNIPSLRQQADEIINIGQVGQYQQQIILAPMQMQTNAVPFMPRQRAMSRERYHLIVCGCDPYESSGRIMLSKNNCLMDDERAPDASDPSDMSRRYSSLTPDIVEELLSYPALLTCQSGLYGKADPSQKAYVGLLNEVRQHTDDIELSCQLIFSFPQQYLDALLHPLGILRARQFCELNHCHWSMKPIDLVTVLSVAGLDPLAQFGFSRSEERSIK